MWDLRFAQPSSQPVVCDFLVTQVDLDVSMDRSAFIFRVRQSSKISGNTRPMTHIKYEKTGIFTVYEL